MTGAACHDGNKVQALMDPTLEQRKQTLIELRNLLFNCSCDENSKEKSRL